MKGKSWVLGLAMGLILVGSLLGFGCKSSTKNADATKTAQSMVTPETSPTAKAAKATKTPGAKATKAAATLTPY